ncbi:MAG: trypsin-like peptidase domain-containing protein [Muribaculaceae bacterium]|nr:trypsin-like peptidase domain-containing protein [Muribaculaceae bacterium]
MYRHYIIPIYSREHSPQSWVGTGFLINDHLITAGHVISRYQKYYAWIAGTQVELLPELWIPTLLPAADKLGYDVAIYPLPGVESPLRLADEDPAKHEHLDLLCWQRTAEGLQQVATTGVVRGECDEDGYFHFATARHITHGSSGSPIMHGDLVYGLVTMGRHQGDNTIKASSALQRTMEENTCWAFKATHINRFMR